MSDPIRRREDEDVERELRVNKSEGLPGGAEGGDESRSADAIVDLPGEPGPLGDTDQHSDSDKVPRREDVEDD